MTKSANSSLASSQLRPSGSWGATCCTNRLATCWPAGASVGSSVDGISISTTGSLRPAVRARIEIGALQIVERRADDDAGAVVVLRRLAGAAEEVRQLRQRHVHAEGARAGLDAGEAATQLGLDGAFRHQIAEQQLGGDVGRDGAGRDALARLRRTPVALPSSTISDATAASVRMRRRAPRPRAPSPA